MHLFGHDSLSNTGNGIFDFFSWGGLESLRNCSHCLLGIALDTEHLFNLLSKFLGNCCLLCFLGSLNLTLGFDYFFLENWNSNRCCDLSLGGLLLLNLIGKLKLSEHNLGELLGIYVSILDLIDQHLGLLQQLLSLDVLAFILKIFESLRLLSNLFLLLLSLFGQHNLLFLFLVLGNFLLDPINNASLSLPGLLVFSLD